MTKELEKTLKILSNYNKKYNDNPNIYCNRIFVHDDLIYATDGRIFVYTKNPTEIKDFSWFDGNKFTFIPSTSGTEASRVREYLKNGQVMEKIITMFNYSNLEFDLDFTDYILPLKCMDSVKNRYFNNDLTLNFETMETTLDFCGGWTKDGGVTYTYEDVLKNVTGEKYLILFMPIYYIMKTMQILKVKKIHIKCYLERRHMMFSAGEYNFIAMTGKYMQ